MEALIRVDNLLIPKDDCLIPCWWDLTVGQTPWVEAQQLLAPFASEILPWHTGVSEESDGAHTISEYYVYYPVRGQQDGRGGMAIATRDGTLDFIFANTDSTSKGLFLPDILRRYGAPSSILLRTFHDRGPFGLPFILALVYEDYRFIARYELEGERIGDNVVGCPSSTPPQITIWGPDKVWTPESIQTHLLGIDYTHPLLPLADSSDFTIEKLYEASQVQDQALCIRTPATLW